MYIIDICYFLVYIIIINNLFTFQIGTGYMYSKVSSSVMNNRNEFQNMNNVLVLGVQNNNEEERELS